MKAIEILKFVGLLPGMPWGADVFFGRNLLNVAEEKKQNFVDVTHRFDPCKQYYVIWDRFEFRHFFEQMPQYDLLISKGDCKKYCWEIDE